MARQDLEKVTIRLYTGDKEKINALFPTIGHNKMIRKLIRRTLKHIEEKINREEGMRMNKSLDINIDIKELDEDE